MNGIVRPREGNRRRGCVQGLYPTADGEWVALCLRDDTERARLAEAMARPELVDDLRLASAPGREAEHDAVDLIVQDWVQARAAAEVVTQLRRHGVPAEQLLTPDRMYGQEQLVARGFYEVHERPITGTDSYPGWPFRITPGPAHHHRWSAPTLGQHNDEVLHALGLTDEEITALRDQRVIGEQLSG